jgi:hypothetical protein
MEINTVPAYQAKDSRGITYSKVPRMQFPVDDQGRTLLVQDMTFYAKSALYDAFKIWRDGGPVCSGRFEEAGALRPALTTQSPSFDQGGKKIGAVERPSSPRYSRRASGVGMAGWHPNGMGVFPQYFRHAGIGLQAVDASEVPAETQLAAQAFPRAEMGAPYTSPVGGAWTAAGPVRGPYLVNLADGSTVTYYWYRFIDQPSFQQYDWSLEKKAKLQAFVERIHAAWSTDREHLAPLRRGTLVAMDPALFVVPPPGLEVGYVPIVTRQEATAGSGW